MTSTASTSKRKFRGRPPSAPPSQTCDSRRNRLRAQASMGRAWSTRKPQRLLPERRELLRGLPAYLSVQVSAACPQACQLPDPRLRTTSGDARHALERFDGILSQMEPSARRRYAEPLGGCAHHPRISESWRPSVAARLRCLSRLGPGLEGWKPKSHLLPPGASDRIDWILSLDASNEATTASCARGHGDGPRDGGTPSCPFPRQGPFQR
jgi:hypothetical protein